MNITSSDTDNKFVIFKLAGQNYGIDIYNVRVIEKVTNYTRVPNSEDYVKGVINLRGEVVPVIDLVKRFGIESENVDEAEVRIIIVSIKDIVVGLLVDSSSEVLTLVKGEIDNTPNIGEQITEEFIKGIGKQDGRLIMLLDLEKVIGIHDDLEDM
ncbi:chemotaxis protein CheW [Sporosalibacterium faouarense]|uniref:chemotaxis protein CheW n=1 Tax=Sporosalibacterium faouarense TaxID=516123 RepID=UPI00141D03E1|nr:chemotaxis protein CheW [Sporosalibacterium faouarense]MTI48014.1 chemotaxis protein CheW [Bacillota bacterium]